MKTKTFIRWFLIIACWVITYVMIVLVDAVNVYVKTALTANQLQDNGYLFRIGGQIGVGFLIPVIVLTAIVFTLITIYVTKEKKEKV